MATISQGIDHPHQLKESQMEPHNNEMMHHWLKGPIHPPGIPRRASKEDNMDCQHTVLTVAVVPVHVPFNGSLHSADPMDSIGVLSNRLPTCASSESSIPSVFLLSHVCGMRGSRCPGASLLVWFSPGTLFQLHQLWRNCLMVPKQAPVSSDTSPVPIISKAQPSVSPW